MTPTFELLPGFGLPEEEITPERVHRWTSKTNYEVSYHVAASTPYPLGHPQKTWISYYLQGYQLLVCGMTDSNKAVKFPFKHLVDLRTVSLLTRPQFLNAGCGFFSSVDKAKVVGETFFRNPSDPMTLPDLPSFHLKYPISEAAHEIPEALRFSELLKERILRLQFTKPCTVQEPVSQDSNSSRKRIRGVLP